MIGAPGTVVDPYDDDFSSLRELFTDARRMPEFIKQASILDPSQLERLPDHAFAVVVLGDGEPLRKYACVDKAHTAVNVMYFLRCQDDLPDGVKEKVATNLGHACSHFGLEPPAQLTKTAKRGKILIKGDGAEIVVPPKTGQEKNSELVGTRTMPLSRPREKTASVMESPYVEITEHTPMVKKAAYDPAVTVLDGALPLLSYDQVLQARDYFDEYGAQMHPRQRHEFCVKLASRADQIGCPVSDSVRKYGSRGYAPRGEIKVAFQMRKQVWRDLDDNDTTAAERGVLDQLFEKRASVDPDVFAEALAELDIETGIDQYWGTGVPDPWFTTFGHEKRAEWEWKEGGEHLTAEALRRLASEGKGALEERFSEQLAEGLAKNPTTVFDSLPLDTKKIIARMAAQRDSGL